MKPAWWAGVFPVLLFAPPLVCAEGRPAAGSPLDMALLEPCLAAAADDSPVYPSRVFPPTTRELAAVFRLGKGQSYRILTAEWVDAASGGHAVARADVRLAGRDRGVIRLGSLHPPRPGTYRLDVAADGQPWRSVEFSVAAGGPVPQVERPQDLVPLDVGTRWTYTLVQQSAKGVRIDLPGISPDPDGRRRGSVTVTVVGADPAGTHVETRVNGALVLEEWWRLGAEGLAITRRRVRGARLASFEPPQLWLPFPLTTPRVWNSEATNDTPRQTHRMWGPVPITTPLGSASGYVVLVEERTLVSAVTAERHFVPGVGLVREVIVRTLDTEVLVRQELALQDVQSSSGWGSWHADSWLNQGSGAEATGEGSRTCPFLMPCGGNQK